MKLYYSPGACSLASHIVLEEIGKTYESEAVNLKTHTTASGLDFYKISPKGAVPTLKLDNGEVLTESAAILQYLADLKPELNLIPKNGTFERVRAQEWLSYIASEVHKAFIPLIVGERLVQNPEGLDQLKKSANGNLERKFGFLGTHFEKNDYLVANKFTVADAYLFTILNWTKSMGPKLDKWPSLMGFVERVKSRPAVQKVLEAEGLKK